MKLFSVLIPNMLCFVQGRCYNGECKTRDNQCKYIWGSSRLILTTLNVFYFQFIPAFALDFSYFYFLFLSLQIKVF